MRYFVQLSFHGKNYHGWQIQPNAPSVQAAINACLSTLLRENISVVGAGRTDAGVHAREMWAHFDTEKPLPQNIVHRMNSMLGRDIAINQLQPVRPEAHARFDAISRGYQYIISLQKDPFMQDFAWQIYQPPAVDLMQAAADQLLHHRDFSAFARSHTQNLTNICEISLARWEQKEGQLIFHIRADRFLRNMVRAIVGTLIEVGNKRKSVDDFVEIIRAKDRSLAGESAPAQGLYLCSVKYPKEIFDVR